VVELHGQLRVLKGFTNGFFLAEDGRVECVREVENCIVHDLVLFADANHMLGTGVKKDASDEL